MRRGEGLGQSCCVGQPALRLPRGEAQPSAPSGLCGQRSPGSVAAAQGSEPRAEQPAPRTAPAPAGSLLPSDAADRCGGVVRFVLGRNKTSSPGWRQMSILSALPVDLPVCSAVLVPVGPPAVGVCWEEGEGCPEDPPPGCSEERPVSPGKAMCRERVLTRRRVAESGLRFRRWDPAGGGEAPMLERATLQLALVGHQLGARSSFRIPQSAGLSGWNSRRCKKGSLFFSLCFSVSFCVCSIPLQLPSQVPCLFASLGNTRKTFLVKPRKQQLVSGR